MRTAIVLIAAALLAVGVLAAVPLKEVDHAAIHRAVEKAAAHDGFSVALSADATLRIGNSLFEKITADIVPVLNKVATDINIPGESQEHFSFNTFHLTSFHLDSISIHFEAPNKLVATLNGLSLATPHVGFEVKDKILFAHIHCSGNVWGSLPPSSITVSLDIVEENGKLSTRYSSTQAHLGSIHVDYKFDHGLCKITGDIIHAFIHEIEKKVNQIINEKLPGIVASHLPSLVNEALAKIPFNIVSQPAITNTGVTVTVDLIKSAVAQQKQQLLAGSTRATPVKAFGPRDLNLGMPEACVDHLLEHFQQEGKLDHNFTLGSHNTSIFRHLLPSVYAACPGCPMRANFHFPATPLVVFGTGSATANVEAAMNLMAVSPKGALVDLFVLALNISAGVTDLAVPNGRSLRFQLAVDAFTMKLEHSSVGPFVPSLISDAISFLLKDVIVPEFNKHFNGLPLPGILSGTELELTPAEFSLGFNVNI